MGAEYAGIFEAHQLIASDPSLLEPVEKIIRTQLVNAEWALDQVVAKFVERFEALPDAHLPSASSTCSTSPPRSSRRSTASTSASCRPSITR